MDENETFRRNLKEAREAAGLNAAELSTRAGLNARMVKDIEEGRSQSPKISTVFKLAKALNITPGELLGIGKPPQLRQELVDLLSQYDADGQERLLRALENFPTRPAA